MKIFRPQWICIACLGLSISLASAIEPRLAYDFNSGTGTSSYGAKSNPAELMMLGPDQQPLSLYGQPGSGLTGKPSDFALDIGKTTQGMGAAGKSGGIARIPVTNGLLGAMTSFTITGWINTASPLDGAARMVEYTDPFQSGFCLFAGGPGMLTLSINKKQISTPKSSYDALNQWIFFAVTYDGSKADQNVVFYGGNPTLEPTVITTAGLDGGKTIELNRYGSLVIGNNGGGIRPAQGMFDNIAIYSSETDASGALSAEQIKEIYKANLNAVPSAQAASERPLKIALIGDSTVCEYPDSSMLRGWGQMLREFTSPGVLYLNEAQGGKSSKNFPPEKWQKILAAKPDFVFIQFGTNDAHGPQAPESTNAATDYKDNLRRFVSEARGASITPVLVTPPHRRLFAAGHLTSELAPYADAMKEVAQELNVPLVDLQEESGKWMDPLGEEKSASITVNRGPNPATDDRSHYTKEGATTLAGFVTKAFPKIDPKLAKVLKAQ